MLNHGHPFQIDLQETRKNQIVCECVVQSALGEECGIAGLYRSLQVEAPLCLFSLCCCLKSTQGIPVAEVLLMYHLHRVDLFKVNCGFLSVFVGTYHDGRGKSEQICQSKLRYVVLLGFSPCCCTVFLLFCLSLVSL